MQPEKFLENFSTHLKNSIARAISTAASLEHDSVTPLHMLFALSEEAGSVAAEILYRVKIETKTILDILENKQKIKPTKNNQATLTASLPELNQSTKQILEKSMLTAYERGHNYIGTEHLLYSILQKPTAEIREFFSKQKINLDSILTELETVLQSTTKFPDMEDVKDAMDQIQGMVEQEPSIQTPTKQNIMSKIKPKIHSALQIFATNITDKNSQKNLDPVIGREKEINRLINILSRRNKNNPVLVGEPGVGKTAIVEGLAKKIIMGDVPDILKRKKILSLDLTLLISGTIYRGEFEARLKQIIDELSNKPDYILFIDELHNIIGAGSNQGTMDAANILKPALARGLLRCIGATTIDEYKKHISSDPALERRFQSINVSEPSKEETKQILAGIKTYYEDFHHVTIEKSAIEAAVDLSSRYIHDNYLPDKAIDLIDEASAAVKSTRKSSVLEIKQISIEQQLEDYRTEKEKAIHNEDFDKALLIKKKEEELEKRLTQLNQEQTKKRKPLRKKVTAEDIAKVVGHRLEISLDFLLSNDWDKIDDVGKKLREQIIGQDHVISELIKTLRQSYIGLKNSKRPFASLLFAGPSGVGKTELAKILAKELYQDEKALVRLDMSEFSEAHGVSKLLGSPAGYVGYKERNRFTDELRRRPYAVVLFDEFDKAHGDVQKLLLQILDEGELTDSHGKKINLQHSIIILTTNLGSELYRSAGIGFGQKSETATIDKNTQNNILSKLKEEFGASIISRIQSTCLFSPLSNEHVQKIITKSIKNISNHLHSTNKFFITPDEGAIRELAINGYNQDSGVRHLDRLIEQTINELVVDIIKKNAGKKEYKLTKNKNHYALI